MTTKFRSRIHQNAPFPFLTNFLNGHAVGHQCCTFGAILLKTNTDSWFWPFKFLFPMGRSCQLWYMHNTTLSLYIEKCCFQNKSNLYNKPCVWPHFSPLYRSCKCSLEPIYLPFVCVDLTNDISLWDLAVLLGSKLFTVSTTPDF